MLYHKVVLGDKDKVILSNQIRNLFMEKDVYFESSHNKAMQVAKIDIPDGFFQNIVQLSSDADWVIREYKEKLYLIALKKE